MLLSHKLQKPENHYLTSNFFVKETSPSKGKETFALRLLLHVIWTKF